MSLVSKLDDPVVAGRMHAVWMVFYAALVPVAVATGWIQVVAFVSGLSILALALSHWSAREAATAQRDLAAQLSRMERKLDELLDSRR